MSTRNPIRLLDESLINNAYPNELLVNFSTGNFTILDGNKNPIYHSKPGSISIFSGNTTILQNTSLTNNIAIDMSGLLSNSNPSSNGTVSAGTSNLAARADHVHPNITPASIGFGYGSCDSATSVVNKTISIANYTLTDGSFVSIRFTYALPANATLNINNTGAKNIFYRGIAITNGIVSDGDLATFVYDGTQFNLISIDYKDGNRIGY